MVTVGSLAIPHYWGQGCIEFYLHSSSMLVCDAEVQEELFTFYPTMICVYPLHTKLLGLAYSPCNFHPCLSRVYMKAVWKVHELTLLLWVGTLWKCGDALYFKEPPLKSNALLTMLHPLLENVLQTIDHLKISYLGAPNQTQGLKMSKKV